MNSEFFVPVLNSLFFYTVGDSNYLFNHKFFDEANDLKGFFAKDYCQKVVNGETRLVQFRSDYTNNIVQILDRDDAVVASPVPAVVWSPAGVDWQQYEVSLPFNTDGFYRVRIEVNDGGGTTIESFSEPIWVKAEWPSTQLIEFSNTENDEGLYFGGSFKVGLRVESHFYKRTPNVVNNVFRQSNGLGVVLSSRSRRRIQLETKQLPTYLHEQLSIGCSLDSIEINGVEFISEEGYTEPEYSSSLYMLANAQVTLETKAGFERVVTAINTFFLSQHLMDFISQPNLLLT